MQRKAARGPMHRAVEAPMAARKASRRQSLQMTAKMGFGNAVETAGEHKLPAVSYRPASSGVVVTAAVPEVVAEDTGPDWDALTFVNPRTSLEGSLALPARSFFILRLRTGRTRLDLLFMVQQGCRRRVRPDLRQRLPERAVDEQGARRRSACVARFCICPGTDPAHMHGTACADCKPTPSTLRIRSRRTRSGCKSHPTRHVCRTQRAV